MSDVRRIDDYLDALARDPNAPPPDGLDPALAETARRVSAAAQVPPLDAATRAHLWSTALARAQAEEVTPITAAEPIPHRDPQPSILHGNGSKGEPMIRSIAHAQEILSLPARRMTGPSLALPWIAALLGVIFLAALLWLGVPDGPPAASPLLQITATPTEVAPTATPLPVQADGVPATTDAAAIDLVADGDLSIAGTLTAAQPVVEYRVTVAQTRLGLLRVIAEAGSPVQLFPTDSALNSAHGAPPVVGRTVYPVQFPIGDTDALWIYVSTPLTITEPVPYRLSIQLFDPAEGDTPSIAYGAPVDGHFDGHHLPMYRFEGTSGDVIRAAVTTANGVDSELMLFQAGFEAADDDSGPGFDPELLDQTLYQTGSYLLAVVPKDTRAVGDFQLTLERTGQQPIPTAPAIPDTSAALREATPITPGVPQRGSLPAEGYASYRFRVEEHTLYAVAVASDDPAGLPDMQYTFQTVALNQRPATGNVAPLTTALDLLDVYPVSNVLLTVIGAPDQAFTLTVTPLTATDLTLDTPVEGTLTGAVPLAIYALHLRAGEAVTLTATGQDGFDTRLALFDWRWQPLTTDSDGGAGRDPEINGYMAPEDSALYAVVLPEQPDAAAGAFTLRMTPAR